MDRLLEMLLGGVLIAVGILVGGVGGLCSAAALMAAFQHHGGEGMMLLPSGLLFGFGVLLLFTGISFIRGDE
jgi:hypothetical protein